MWQKRPIEISVPEGRLHARACVTPCVLLARPLLLHQRLTLALGEALLLGGEVGLALEHLQQQPQQRARRAAASAQRT